MLFTLLPAFVQHKGDKLMVTHEDDSGSSCDVFSKFQTNMAEMLPQEDGFLGVSDTL